ncbi:hypothetical protein F5B22DRAFT_613209 [Xylaria bambusicola]|uniref:uncharacterized protein n=1 Tax=Xylaria bambusicola TaxID=326684 RepID=UPI0020089E4E|nr:uncharacterized protein F5B22DRAFT_613209 [Xylaria bambusicola]KAI0513043.1 hypothetical protein F5B22DRAFT_613209 [Xylaria bambusicola]
MEAIAAAGALPGLASATIQLGTATFQFYQQLHSLYKAIKHGEKQLGTVVKQLDQHGDFIKELRFSFEHITVASIPASTHRLFERCIVDSEREVEEFRQLLDRVGKHRFEKKTLHAIETGSRLRFHEHSIQKYCDLLDKQMHRFLFLQSSVQSIRVESSLSEVMTTLVKQGAKAANFYDEHSALLKTSRGLRSASGTISKREQLLMGQMDRSSRTASPSPQSVIPGNWSIIKTKGYSTLCGTVTVATFSDSEVNKGKRHQLAYKVRFKPYSWISRTLVEWRCLFSPSPKIHTMLFSVTTSILCDDPDVLDALGFVRSSDAYWGLLSAFPWFWTMKVPNSGKIRALLNTGRLLKDHVLWSDRSDPVDVITAFILSYESSHKEELSGLWNRDPNRRCTESNRDYLSQQYLEFYRVIELLLSWDFQPHLSSWQHIYGVATRHHYHLLTEHPEVIGTFDLTLKPISLLILETCGFLIPLDYKVTFHDRCRVMTPYLTYTGTLAKSYVTYHDPYNLGDSYLAHFVAEKDPVARLKGILELDPLDLTEDRYMFDRWLLGVFALFRPETASLVRDYINSYQTMAARNLFSIDYIREEFRQPPRESNKKQRRNFLIFVCAYGNPSIIQEMDLTALTAAEIRGMLFQAAQCSNPEIFDLLISQSPKEAVNVTPHAPRMREKLTNDPTFLDNYVKILFDCDQWPLAGLFRDPGTSSTFFLPKSQPLPNYVEYITLGCIQRYEMNPLAVRIEVRSLIWHATKEFWGSKAPAALLLQDLHFYDVLRKLVRIPACKSHLDISNFVQFGYLVHVTSYTGLNEFQSFPYPSVDGYSALMLALHCGMKPAVQILVDAGASVSEPMCCGKSALSLARENIRSRHPRRWAVCRDPVTGVTIPTPRGVITPEMDILESTDREMLEILLEALRERGEIEPIDSDDLTMPSRWKLLRGKVGHFAAWLFKPSYSFDPDSFRENSIYTILVSTLWLLSVLKVLKAELGDLPSSLTRVLSRPVVILALLVWILSRFW